MAKSDNRKKKRYCKRGHDVLICGRLSNRSCIDCYNEDLKIKRLNNAKNKNIFCVNGHNILLVGRNKWGTCTVCYIEVPKKYRQKHKKFIRIRARQYQLEHKKEIRAYQRLYSKTEKRQIYIKVYNKTEKVKQIKRKSDRKLNRTKKRKEYLKMYWKKHPEIVKLNALKQHKKRKKRIPKFGQTGIRKFYINCHKNKQVDHIIPLLGKLVSGLHVSWNLQYLTPKQNRLKGIQIDLLKISEDYGKLLKKLGLK